MRFLPLLFASVAVAHAEVRYHNPVRAGDFPDPSIIRLGSEYWAAATSSEWAPHFPILHSRDLVNWEVTGYVFANAPAWAKANFWAPEIAEDHGKFFVYYVARDRASNHLAVAVATAEQPGGPYTDHGILVTQDAGSIDPVPFTDAQGLRWLIWKEDGNSRKLPTILWLQRLSDDGLKLVGERREILRNDVAWEGAVVEGPFVVRRGEYYYLFYSGNACCGRSCNYALGVARAKDMAGPWEKYSANPILAGNEAWRCPGHGSIVSDPEGRSWLLYHAYAQKGFVATGRELLLDEVRYWADGWPTINAGHGPTTDAAAPAATVRQDQSVAFRDEFTAGTALAPGWQWPIGRRPNAQMRDGRIFLTVDDDSTTAVRSIAVPSFVAETAVIPVELSVGAEAGLVAFGDRADLLALVTDGKTIRLESHRRGERVSLAEAPIPAGATMIRLRIASVDGKLFRFATQNADGRWRELGENIDGSFLPPWDRGVRTGLYVSGPKAARASFDYFSLTPDDAKLFTP
jgi:xylan 1,4-beta-xylosidase